MLYLAVGALWILLSDQAVAAFSSDPATLTALQTLKGWLYVCLTSVLAYVAVRLLLQREHHVASARGALRRLTYFDHLTGLPNRHHLLERIERTPSSRGARCGALLLLDVDGFRRINDALGPAVGDRLLRAIADLLRSLVADETRLARVSTDVYAVLIKANAAQHALEDARQLAAMIHARLPEVEHSLQSGIAITVCVGISRIDANESDAHAALARAETALHRAQERGLGQLCVYDSDMQAEAEARLAAAGRLRQALDNGQMHAYLQPQCDPDGRTVGAELLARWIDADQRIVPPSEFIALAEDTGMIGALGEQMLQAACELSVRLRRRGLAVRLAVNLSAQQLLLPGFVEQVERLLQITGADPHDLTLEVTESVLIDGLEAAAAVLAPLRARGFHISLDDFGTGYSSLSYLKQLPVDELKIDGSFVRDATDDPRGRALIEAITAVASVLGLDVVAEGVESAEQAELLVACGCTILQGYWFARPMPVAEFEERLASEADRPGHPLALSVDAGTQPSAYGLG